jgi:excisionase family DNA binding protein
MHEVLTVGVREAAQILGVSPWSIRRWIRLGKLPAVKLGRRTVVELAALRQFVQSSRIREDQIHDIRTLGVRDA